MSAIIKKITSRKFIAAVVGVIMGIALAFGADGDTITNVAGAVVSVASIITYIIAEGKVDAAAVNMTVELVEELTAEAAEETEED